MLFYEIVVYYLTPPREVHVPMISLSVFFFFFLFYRLFSINKTTCSLKCSTLRFL